LGIDDGAISKLADVSPVTVGRRDSRIFSEKGNRRFSLKYLRERTCFKNGI
jgi:hypothetical protein